MIRRLWLATGGGLVLFHAWLLAGQAWEGELLDPWLLLRWLVAAGLTGGLMGLLRSGVPLVWSRRAVALWILAAFLHGPVVLDRVGADAQNLADAVAVAGEIVAVSLSIGIAFAVLAMRRRTVMIVTTHVASRLDFVHGFRNSFISQSFAPRPPPLT